MTYRSKSPYGDQLDKFHWPLILEMIVCRSVDNYLVYISELLALVFKTRPEMLKSSDMVKLDFVLKHESMNDLINALAEQKVSELSYQGMRELSTFLSKRFDFGLFTEPNELEQAIQIVQARNLIVHNRGIVNAIYLSRVSNAASQIGRPIFLTTMEVFEDIMFLGCSVADIENRAISKYGLPVDSNIVNGG